MQRQRQKWRVAALWSRAVRQSWRRTSAPPLLIGRPPKQRAAPANPAGSARPVSNSWCCRLPYSRAAQPNRRRRQACAARRSASGSAVSPPRSRPAPFGGAAILELETGALLLNRRDDKQGRLIQQWIEDQVLTAFSGQILAVDTAVARR